MKHLFRFLLFVSPLTGITQGKGIHFEKGMSWQRILDKAKAEKKYVFVDCYASWCGPCKWMDENVYLQNNVADYMNEFFISIKVQIDTTKNDSEQVKAWYNDAHALQQQYKVTAYPCYLFFSPDGEIVHRDLGARIETEFIRTASNATNRKRQYFTLLAQYKSGMRDYSSMEYLANMAKRNDNGLEANNIAKDYIENYLLNLSDPELYTKKHIAFIVSFISNTRDKTFELFYLNARIIDSVMESNNYAEKIVDYIITKDEIIPYLSPEKKLNNNIPKWGVIYKRIKNKYGPQYSDRTILDSKIRWYKGKKMWSRYTRTLKVRVDKYGAFGSGFIDLDYNNCAWEIFLHSNNKIELNQALIWSNKALKINSAANWMDTHANILYKLGKRDEAIKWEEKAIKQDPKDNAIRGSLDKMKRRVPTWN